MPQQKKLSQDNEVPLVDSLLRNSTHEDQHQKRNHGKAERQA